MIVASLDIAVTRPIDAVWTDTADGVVHHQQLPKNDSQAILDWAAELAHPSVIAIDAPSKKNKGRAKLNKVRRQLGCRDGVYLNYRVCEALLKQRGIGLYPTPQQKPPAWIQLGWEIYRQLSESHAYNIWDQPGPVRLNGKKRFLIEVHPHASFVVGLGWIPQKKSTLAGQLERIAYLDKNRTHAGIELTGECYPNKAILRQFAKCFHTADITRIFETGFSLPHISHDILDALAGLVTVLQCLQGQACAVGETNEGVIVLPAEPHSVESPYKLKR